MCSGIKHQVAQLKLDDNDIADQARNDVIKYKLVCNEDYQKFSNHNADLILLPVSLMILTTGTHGKMESVRIIVDEELIRSSVVP